MGLGPCAVNLYLELWQRGIFRNIKSVIEMGSQEIHMKSARFEELLKNAGIDTYRPEKFPNLANWPGQPRTSSKPFFELLGVEKYTSLDLNGELGSVNHDLNFPFENKKQWGIYDLVTDHGTNEHAFNVAESYRTMHNLCKQNGYIIISQAVFGGNGYFHFDLAFFEGLAAANKYKILFSSFEVTDPSGENQHHIPLSRELLKMMDFSKVGMVGITYVFQKLTNEDFKVPYQGNFLSQMQKNSGYQLQFLPHPPSRTYVPNYTATDLNSYSAKTLVKALAKKVLRKIVRIGDNSK